MTQAYPQDVANLPGLKGGFSSDNVAGASKEVMDALIAASVGAAQPYGADEFTQRMEARLRDIFECDLKVFLVATGSAANGLSLATLTPPWGAVLCHQDSHINNDECGAPEFYSAGAKLVSVAGENSKISPAALRRAAQNKVGDVHSVQPACVSVTQITESGSLYSLEEIEEIGAICRDHGLKYHMDGARFANALVALDCTPAQMTRQAGVDILSFGATKNGVLAAEAIIVFDTSLSDELAFRRKRAGHLTSKMRLLSAQLEAYLKDDLWLNNAQHANAMAARLVQGLSDIQGVKILGPSQANIIFCQLPEPIIQGLLAQGFRFYHDRWGKGVVRLVTSFATALEEVDALIQSARQLSATSMDQ
ncbi:putative low specificity l-threonine aldolase protein [Marinomonas sp. MED121]|uniref:threonine aldolase family protein n=1 Tax=Marinomonas sp. MED121 TaxID=314277 RepID=UPI000068FA86|nr:low specificity L-threonine aldolase [Marinomonas sp. MED121]EAQ63875.1 putative low specificity l-threonine aldolase protein [Marinomonas sp. MED121]